MSGEEFDLKDDEKILEINSPKSSVGGPYFVVYKDLEEQWAIVAMRWNKKPALGIRWFNRNIGNPISYAHPIWLVIPSLLNTGILNTLPIECKFKCLIDEFLFRDKIDEMILKELNIVYNKSNFFVKV